MENASSETLSLLLYFYPMFLDDVTDDMICLENTDAMLTLDDVDIEGIYYLLFLEGIIKRVSNALINISKQILFCVATRI